MACSHKDAIDENADLEEVQEPELVVREWYPTPKRSFAQPGIAVQPGHVGMRAPQYPPVVQYQAAPPQQQYQAVPQPAPQQHYQAAPQPVPQQQYQAVPQQAPQQQYVQPVPAYQYPPRPWGPQPYTQPQPQVKAQAPVPYNPWQTGTVVTPGWGAVPVYPGWGGPGIWAGAP